MSVQTEGRRDAQIGFRIRSDLKAELERLAKADGRSLANYLERLFEAHLEAKRKQEGKRR
jgi:predicted DNA-binding protein